MKHVLASLIIFYQKCVRPFMVPACRFYPTCSDYALAALKKYSFLKAAYLIAHRLLRCHPFATGGYDPLL